MSELFKPKRINKKDLDSLLEQPKEETFPEHEIGEREQFFSIYKYVTANCLEWQLMKKLVPLYMSFDIIKKKNTHRSDFDYKLGISFKYDYQTNELEHTNIFLSEWYKKPPKWKREKRLVDMMKVYAAYVTDKPIHPSIIDFPQEIHLYGHFRPQDRLTLSVRGIKHPDGFTNSIYSNIKYGSDKYHKYRIVNTEIAFLKENLEFFKKGEYTKYAFLPKEDVIELSMADAIDYPELKVIRNQLKQRK